MRYEDIIKTVSEMIDNENIKTKGLTMVYELEKDYHGKLDEYLYYKGNPTGTNFKHNKVIQVELGDIVIKFIPKGDKLIIN